MNTSQLLCCINCSPVLKTSILGVFAADQLPKDLRFPCGFIANTDDHLNDGRHWCSFYSPNSTTIEYFDSFGKSIDYFNTYFSKYTSVFDNIVVNFKQLQSDYSDLCGMYCLFFLLQRINGVSFHDIVYSFSNDSDYNDSVVYSCISNMFPYCVNSVNVNKQICRPLIKCI